MRVRGKPRGVFVCGEYRATFASTKLRNVIEEFNEKVLKLTVLRKFTSSSKKIYLYHFTTEFLNYRTQYV